MLLLFNVVVVFLTVVVAVAFVMDVVACIVLLLHRPEDCQQCKLNLSWSQPSQRSSCLSGRRTP